MTEKTNPEGLGPGSSSYETKHKPIVPHDRKPNKLTHYRIADEKVSDKTILWDDLVKMVERPTFDLSGIPEKDVPEAKQGLPALSASAANRKTKNAVVECNSMTLLWVDLDSGRWQSLQPLVRAVEALGLESFVIYTTLRHLLNPDVKPRWRVVIELVEPIDLPLWQACQEWLAVKLDGDVSALKPTQILFLPAKGPGGYLSHIGRGVALNAYR
jgi:hypothetical protein